MPEKMKFCPNCKNELNNKDWNYLDTDDSSWFSSVEKWFCECPHCKKILWLTLPYDLNEDGVYINIEEKGD